MFTKMPDRLHLKTSLIVKDIAVSKKKKKKKKGISSTNPLDYLPGAFLDGGGTIPSQSLKESCLVVTVWSVGQRILVKSLKKGRFRRHSAFLSPLTVSRPHSYLFIHPKPTFTHALDQHL